jgi:hypothetical protein
MRGVMARFPIEPTSWGVIARLDPKSGLRDFGIKESAQNK